MTSLLFVSGSHLKVVEIVVVDVVVVCVKIFAQFYAGVGVGAGGRAWAGDGAVVAAVADLGKITSHPNCLDLDNSQNG